MKNIFKKNSIIITALAIMIVIAGYLSFTSKDAKDDGKNVADASATSEDNDDYVAVEGMDLVSDTTDGTTPGVTNAADDTNTTDDTNATDDTNTTDDTDEETTDLNAEDANDELGSSDISDDDILANAKDVTDNGELDPKDGTPGEAVLASAAIDPSYFLSKKLEREQVRANSKQTLMDIISSTDITEESKKDALDGMIELTKIAEKESAAEMLLEAKGFDGVIVFIVDGTVDVVVNAATLSEQQLAIIEDIVKNETGISVGDIDIIPVVVSE